MAADLGSRPLECGPVRSAGAFPERYRALTRWLNDGGAELDRCSVAPTAFGYGLEATRAIDDGEVIAGIPVTHVLCGRHVQESDVWHDFKAVGADSSPEAAPNLRNAMLVLMVVHRDRESRFGPYLRSLPDRYDVPILWESDQEEELRGTNLEHVVPERRAALRRAFDWLTPRLQRHKSELYGALTWPAFLWAHAGYTSRAFTQELLPASHRVREKVGCLLPFLDLANHRHRTRIAWECTGGNAPGVSRKRARYPPRVQLRAGAGIAAGEEVFNNYAAKSNESWLLDFGFGIPDNEHDYALLKLRRAPGKPWQVRTASLLAAAATTAAAAAKATAAAESGGSQSSAADGRTPPPPPFSHGSTMAQWTCEDSNLALPKPQSRPDEAMWGTSGPEPGSDDAAHFLFSSHLSPPQVAGLCATLMRPDDCYAAEMLLPLRPLPVGGLRALASLHLASRGPHPRPFALGTDALWRPQLERHALFELHAIATRRLAAITGRHASAAACEDADNVTIRDAAAGREVTPVALGVAAYRRGQRAVYRGTALCVSRRLRELQEQATPSPSWRALEPNEGVDAEALLESHPLLRAVVQEIDRPEVLAVLALAWLAAGLCEHGAESASAPAHAAAHAPYLPATLLSATATAPVGQNEEEGGSMALLLFGTLVAGSPPLCCSDRGRAFMSALGAVDEWDTMEGDIEALHRAVQPLASDVARVGRPEEAKSRLQWLASMLSSKSTRRWLYGAALRCAATLEDGRVVISAPLAAARPALAAASPLVVSGQGIEVCTSGDDGRCRFGGDASTWSQLLLARADLCSASLSSVAGKATLSRPGSDAGAEVLRRCGLTRTHLLVSTSMQHVSPRLVLAASVCAFDEGACKAVHETLSSSASEEEAQRVIIDRLADADGTHLEQVWALIRDAVARGRKKAARAADKVAAMQLDADEATVRAGVTALRRRIAVFDEVLAAVEENLGTRV